ncbi:MAG: T9SS type A sorting domain-containing protein [Bacteroidales bacterium]|nr:T9SS type A sorting domain-containing protein [Bacteroidales bacterium]
MKKNLLIASAFFLASLTYGQWTPISIENTTTSVVALTGMEGTVFAGLAGDGIFVSSNAGDSWTDISGDLPDKNINYLFGATIDEPFFAGTQGGPFVGGVINGNAQYINATGTGLPSTDITYFGKSDDVDELWVAGTRNQGVFTASDNENLVWNAANNGLSGDALKINGLSGYSDDTDTWALSTGNGIYFSQDQFSSWTSGNNGLSGDQLIVTGSLVLNTITLITTHNGAFMTQDLGQSWSPLIPGVKFNALVLAIDYNSGQAAIFFLGESSYVTSDFINFTSLVTPGEIIAATTSATDLFIATAQSKNSNTTGGLYRQPISTVITAISRPTESASLAMLQQNNPNPFSQSTTINYSVKESEFVTIKIYDLMGKEISTLVNGFTSAGNHQVTLENAQLPAGLYCAVLKTKNNLTQIKMIKE